MYISQDLITRDGQRATLYWKSIHKHLKLLKKTIMVTSNDSKYMQDLDISN